MTSTGRTRTGFEPYVEVWRLTEISFGENLMSTLFGMRWAADAHDGQLGSTTVYACTRSRAISKAVRQLRNREDAARERIALKDLV